MKGSSWKFISPQAQQTRRTKKLGHQKSPQPDITAENKQAVTTRVKLKINLTQKLLHYRKKKENRKKQFEGHTTTKRNGRNEEYKTAKRTRRKPRRLVVKTTITTRKH